MIHLDDDTVFTLYLPVIGTVSLRHLVVIDDMQELQNKLKSVARKHVPEPISLLSSISTPVLLYCWLPNQTHIDNCCQKPLQLCQF